MPANHKALAYTQAIDGSPAVFVDGFIYEGFGMYLARYVHDLWTIHGKRVKVFISSHGGLLTEGTAFYDFIRAKGIELEVEIFGKAGSAATVIASAAGREHITISENSEYFIHRASLAQEDCNGDYIAIAATSPEAQAELERVNALLVNIYVLLTGKTAEEISALLDKGDEGLCMSAEEAVANGFCGAVITPIAINIAAFKTIAAAHKNMSETKNKLKVAVKLNLAKALASLGADGTEVDVDVEEAVAKQIADLTSENTALKGQIETLEAAKPAEGAPTAEDVQVLNSKVSTLTTSLTEKTAEAATASAQALTLAAKVKELEAKIPLAQRTIADNKDAKIGGSPNGEPENPNVVALKKAVASASGLQKNKA